MCTGAEMLIAGSTAVSALGNLQQGSQANKFYGYKANQAEADAEAERQMGEVRAGKVRKAGALVQSEVRAGYAGSGIDVSSGTPTAVGEKVGRNIEEDALTELLTGQRRGRVLQAEAQGYRASGANAMNSARIGAVTSILGGTASYMNSQQQRDRWIRMGNMGMGTGMTGTPYDPNW